VAIFIFDVKPDLNPLNTNLKPVSKMPTVFPPTPLYRYGFFQTVFYFGSVSQMCLAFALMCGAAA
jgi:hypothetical protein